MKFITIFTSTLFFLLPSGAVFSQSNHIESSFQLPAHPRILLLKGEEEALKKSIGSEKTLVDLQNAILMESDSIIILAPIERIQIGRRLLDKSREAIRRIFFLSYAYRITKDEKYLKRAEKELLAISAFKDWNPPTFLDVAEMTLGVAIGYDWLYDYLSPASRSLIKEAILKKGIEPSLHPKNNGWLKAEHNWNQVCNAGMVYGALAIYEDQPELAKKIINRAIDAVVISMKDYGPDGAYPEGASYWGYGTSFNVLLISALEKLFKTDFALSEMPGFIKTAGYMQNMTGPIGKNFNYSDSRENGGPNPAMYWFANKLKDPSLLWIERSRLKELNIKSSNNRLLPAILLWGSNIGISNITAPKPLMWVGKGKNPVALMRTSWKDSTAIYVAIKGGSASVNHAHMDIGSFIMDAGGVRWAMDFGMQDYESLESKKIDIWGRKQNAQRWTVFRYMTQAHNTLTVNNQQQRVDGYAPLMSSSSKTKFMNATIDLTETYKGALSKANRGIGIVNKQYVLVRDEVEAADTITTIRWTLLTPASVTITGKNTAELMKDGKKLVLQVQEPATVMMKTWSTDPPNSYDAPNPGTTLVGFELTIPAKTTTAITVALIPQEAFGKAVKKIASLQNWNRR